MHSFWVICTARAGSLVGKCACQYGQTCGLCSRKTSLLVLARVCLAWSCCHGGSRTLESGTHNLPNYRRISIKAIGYKLLRIKTWPNRQVIQHAYRQLSSNLTTGKKACATKFAPHPQHSVHQSVQPTCHTGYALLNWARP